MVALDLTGPLGLQSRDAAAGLRLWAEASDVDLRVVDVEGAREAVDSMYWSWSRTEPEIVLLPYGSGLVRAGLEGVAQDRLVWNHGGSDDTLARPWAPMVPAPASTYFVPLVGLAVERGCRALTVVRGPGGFAGQVSLGALVHADELGLPAELVALTDWESGRLGPESALLVVGRFEDDVAVVTGLGRRPALVGCVAAGIPAFGREAGARAEGIVGPAQWWPESTTPELGPSGREFADRYEERYGGPASYVAAQAAAGGYLALAAAEASMTPDEVAGWSTSTLLGAFEVDEEGRQVGHRVRTVRWHEGAMERVG